MAVRNSFLSCLGLPQKLALTSKKQSNKLIVLCIVPRNLVRTALFPLVKGKEYASHRWRLAKGGRPGASNVILSAMCRNFDISSRHDEARTLLVGRIPANLKRVAAAHDAICSRALLNPFSPIALSAHRAGCTGGVTRLTRLLLSGPICHGRRTWAIRAQWFNRHPRLRVPHFPAFPQFINLFIVDANVIM